MKAAHKSACTDVNKICPRCHGSFHCDVKEGCWCENVTLGKDTLKKLRRDYIDCLCEKCLKTFEATKITSTAH